MRENYRAVWVIRYLFFDCEEQQGIWEYYQESHRLPNSKQLEEMMQCHKNGSLDRLEINKIMNMKPKKERW